MRFTGKKILITGGSQGIGRACADLMAKEGGEIIGTYSRDEQAATRAAAAIIQAGGRATMIKADLGSESDTLEMWRRATIGAPVDVLILNAAFQKKALFEDTDLALLERTLRVNVGGNFQLAKLFIDDCRKRKASGTIVVHSSNQGEMVNPTGFAYGISKAALNHLVRHLARAVARDRIRVNGVLLGWFDTDGERKFYSAEQIAEQGAAGIPVGRAGDPVEAANMAAFLAADESSYMTGSMVRYDGGFALDPDLST
jgi:NAD(P)-dependent dehydrogenase (short-subunit alcohol dehydrogenase family)